MKTTCIAGQIVLSKIILTFCGSLLLEYLRMVMESLKPRFVAFYKPTNKPTRPHTVFLLLIWLHWGGGFPCETSESLMRLPAKMGLPKVCKGGDTNTQRFRWDSPLNILDHSYSLSSYYTWTFRGNFSYNKGFSLYFALIHSFLPNKQNIHILVV